MYTPDAQALAARGSVGAADPAAARAVRANAADSITILPSLGVNDVAQKGLNVLELTCISKETALHL